MSRFKLLHCVILYVSISVIEAIILHVVIIVIAISILIVISWVLSNRVLVGGSRHCLGDDACHGVFFPS